MLPHALRHLLVVQAKAVVRNALRRAKSPRGAIFFALGLLMFFVWLAPVVFQARARQVPAEQVRNVMPLVMLAFALVTTLTSAGERAIAFTGGETDLLFPGPFTRRQLLLYKVVKGVFVAAATGLFMSIVLYQYATYWVASFAGAFMTVLFVQLAGTVALLAGEALGARGKSRGRLLVLVVVATLAVLALRAAAGDGWYHAIITDPLPVVRRIGHSWAGQVLLAPFTVMTRTLTAERLWPDLPLWAAAAAAINALLVIALLRLDRYFIEAAAGASERRYERMRRMRSGGGLAVSARPTARRSLPALPRLRGAGVIAWRQLTHAVRTSRTLLTVLAILAVAVGWPVVAGTRAQNPTTAGAAMFAALAWMSVLLAAVLRFDFRADLDAIETLKMLPLSPSAVAAGQLVAPTIVMTLFHWAVLGVAAGVTANGPIAADVRGPLLVAAVVAPPFNLLMFAAENLIFLLAPVRPGGGGPGDFSLLGRQIVTLAIRTLGVSIGVAVAAAAGAAAYFVFGRSLTAAAVVGFAALSAEAAGMVPLIGLAFSRFDPSKHMPA